MGVHGVRSQPHGIRHDPDPTGIVPLRRPGPSGVMGRPDSQRSYANLDLSTLIDWVKRKV